MLIYKATNKVNKKIYIGQTTKTLNQRKNKHLHETRQTTRKRTYFHNALAKYGIENFDFSIIEYCKTQMELNQREQYWIQYYHSNDKEHGYNLDSGGKNCKKSEITKQRISICKREHWKRPDVAKKMMDGLTKATDTWVKQCEENRILIKCEECGKEIYLPPYESRRRKYCSTYCANSHNIKLACKAAAKSQRDRHNKLHQEIKEEVLSWAQINRGIALNCPNNKVETTYKGLKEYIGNKYGIRDMRTIIFAVVGSYRKKEFAQYIKTFLV